MYVYMGVLGGVGTLAPPWTWWQAVFEVYISEQFSYMNQRCKGGIYWQTWILKERMFVGLVKYTHTYSYV